MKLVKYWNFNEAMTERNNQIKMSELNKNQISNLKSNRMSVNKVLSTITLVFATIGALFSCKPRGAESAVSGDAASKVYVAPGKYDEFYNIVSGGFNGQIGIYGLPSGRLFRIVPVFTQSAESGYGYSEETKPMLNTSHGFVPWDDLHHISLSRTNGNHDGRWAFANGNNTPRIARIDLTTFRTS
jgi:nitrous-oxide reductase